MDSVLSLLESVWGSYFFAEYISHILDFLVCIGDHPQSKHAQDTPFPLERFETIECHKSNGCMLLP